MTRTSNQAIAFLVMFFLATVQFLQAQEIFDATFCLSQPRGGCNDSIPDGHRVSIRNLPRVTSDGKDYPTIYYVVLAQNVQNRFVSLALARSGECYSDEAVQLSSTNQVQASLTGLWNRVKRMTFADVLNFFGIEEVTVSTPVGNGDVRLRFVKPEESGQSFLWNYRFIHCSGDVHGAALTSEGQPFPGRNSIRRVTVTE